jgi:hypothetical protein
MSARRDFIRLISWGGAAALMCGPVAAADPMLDEKDPLAVSLGYVADATKTNKTKFPKYEAGQVCTSCALYQGKAPATAGPCPLYAGKQVAAKGWCSAYAKKA